MKLIVKNFKGGKFCAKNLIGSKNLKVENFVAHEIKC
jgi:hypothetical protein